MSRYTNFLLPCIRVHTTIPWYHVHFGGLKALFYEEQVCLDDMTICGWNHEDFSSIHLLKAR